MANWFIQIIHIGFQTIRNESRILSLFDWSESRPRAKFNFTYLIYFYTTLFSYPAVCNSVSEDGGTEEVLFASNNNLLFLRVMEESLSLSMRWRGVWLVVYVKRNSNLCSISNAGWTISPRSEDILQFQSILLAGTIRKYKLSDFLPGPFLG